MIFFGIFPFSNVKLNYDDDCLELKRILVQFSFNIIVTVKGWLSILILVIRYLKAAGGVATVQSRKSIKSRLYLYIYIGEK